MTRHIEKEWGMMENDDIASLLPSFLPPSFLPLVGNPAKMQGRSTLELDLP